ncbi:nuclear factor 7, ovary-like [Symsagittifera roscoffensis]|uniref:nuclear factor 7, ovary-like n=1 Tax=Symsagittifera roscoffensis TaxID=84072 RepID=UPI00307C3F89
MVDLYVRNGCMCYLCGEPFNRPRVLDCGDSFCHECLDKILKENRGSALKCPQCYHPLDNHRGSPHRVLSIEAAKKRREQVGISLEAYSRSVKETSETLSKMSAYIQTFISNDLQRAEDICYIYQQSSIYERELKKKREVLDEALEEQRILVARFHREAKKELDEKFTAVEDALRKVGDQN